MIKMLRKVKFYFALKYTSPALKDALFFVF